MSTHHHHHSSRVGIVAVLTAESSVAEMELINGGLQGEVGDKGLIGQMPVGLWTGIIAIRSIR